MFVTFPFLPITVLIFLTQITPQVLSKTWRLQNEVVYLINFRRRMIKQAVN